MCSVRPYRGPHTEPGSWRRTTVAVVAATTLLSAVACAPDQDRAAVAAGTGEPVTAASGADLPEAEVSATTTPSPGTVASAPTSGTDPTDTTAAATTASSAGSTGGAATVQGPGTLTPSGTSTASTTAPTTASTGAGEAQLPRGGTRLFPRYRLVGYSGGTARSFGRLGIGRLQARLDEIETLGASYDGDGREALPVMELIATVVQASPGADGMYRARIPDREIARYLRVARRNKALLLLNIQPGRADFLTEVKAYRRWLAEPDVGLALDPEWAVGAHERPGEVFGSTSARELNQVSLWLSEFVAEHDLPEKALVVHQLAAPIISRVQELRTRRGVQIILSVDGIGSRAAKVETWRTLVRPLPAGIHTGFKLFLEEDREYGRLMTAAEVLRLRPKPEYVLYE